MDGIIYEIRLVVEVPKDWTKEDVRECLSKPRGSLETIAYPRNWPSEEHRLFLSQWMQAVAAKTLTETKVKEHILEVKDY